MKRRFGLIVLILILAVVVSACEQAAPVAEEVTQETVPTVNPEEATIDDIEGLLSELISRPELISDEKPDEIISTEHANLGLLQVCYDSDTDAKLKLQVIQGDNRIVYNLFGRGSVESFSLQFGSGEYTVRIMENVEDDQYMVVETKTFEVEIEDEIEVYLNSIQNVNWDYDKLPIEDIPYIVYDSIKDPDDDVLFDFSEDLYFFVTDYIEYDNQKIEDLPYNYVPDIEETYLDKTGLCYDYASLYASMLRSIGVPAKLVKGYASSNPDVYHAWTEVYIDGRWMILDPTMGSGEFGKFTLIDAERNAEDYVKVNEY